LVRRLLTLTRMNDDISTLNNLITTCRDGQEGFRTAAEHLKDQQFKTLFEQFARERGEIAAELEQLVARRGGEPQREGSLSGTLHRGWMDLRGALTRGDEQIIAEAERGEDVAKGAFESALAAIDDPDIRTVVDRAYQRVAEAHNRVRAMEDGVPPR
jgi:uncharacterized protein (TIGR02284 family)